MKIILARAKTNEKGLIKGYFYPVENLFLDLVKIEGKIYNKDEFEFYDRFGKIIPIDERW